MFDAECVRKTPSHFKKYAHPGRDAKYASNVSSGQCCPYDLFCHKQNPSHYLEYAHPRKDASKGASGGVGSGGKEKEEVPENKAAVTIGDSTVYVDTGKENAVPPILKSPKIVGVRGKQGDKLIGYHVTSDAIADVIVKEGFRSSAVGSLGPGIYFDKSKEDSYDKSQAIPKDAYLKCEVTIGPFLLVRASTGSALNEAAVNYAGCTGAYRAEHDRNDEFVVYSMDQVKILEKGRFDIAVESGSQKKEKPICIYDELGCKRSWPSHFTKYAHPKRDAAAAAARSGSSGGGGGGLISVEAADKVAITIGDSTVYVNKQHENSVPSILKDTRIVGVRGNPGDTLVGYHVTTKTFAESIAATGFPSSTRGSIGPGIYFAKSKKEFYYKSTVFPKDAFLKCDVALGRYLLVNAAVPQLNETAVNFAGCTGVYRVESGKNDEWLVYSASQVKILEKGAYDVSTDTEQ